MTLIDAGERERAAHDFSRNLVVTAGAGTGKTSLLIERILHLVLERGTSLERIAAITFTKKAAAEMRERLEDALERILVLAADARASTDSGQEADRVFLRLPRDGISIERIRHAAATAIDALEGASIGTVHSFASGLLRRHAEEAGVDVGFVEDEGVRATELFGELWAREVESAMGAEAVPGGWRGLLERISIDGVEEVARRLVGLAVPIEALGESAVADQRECARRLIESLRGAVKRIRGATSGVKGVSRNLDVHLDHLDEALDRFDAGDELPCDIDDLRLPNTPTLGKNADVPGKEELEEELHAALRGVENLAASDPKLAGFVALALRSFVERFRREHLRRGFVSLDGLIVLARNLLRDHADVRRQEGRRFEHVLVDELQDTDPVQYEIIFYLAEDPKAKGSPAADAFSARLVPGKLFIVGDAKQSIYHFRGADVRAYARAVETLKLDGADLLVLATNFRSVPEIVEPLNALFAGVFDSANATEYDPRFESLSASRARAPGAAVEIWSVGRVGLVADARRRVEAVSIARWLHEEIRAGKLRPRDAAILLKTRSTWDTYLAPLRKLGIPYVIQGGKGFYSRLEVEILVAILKAVTSPADPIALVACLRSPVFAVPDRELQLHAEAQAAGRKKISESPWNLRVQPDATRVPGLSRALESLRGLASRHGSATIDRLACAVIEETPLRLAMASMHDGAQRVLNLEKAVRRIASLAADGRMSGEEILARIEEEDSSDVAGGDSPLADDTYDAVRVLTVHGAKGLEWPVVIVPDLAQGRRSGGSGTEVAAAGGAPPCLALAVEGAITPAHVAREVEEKRHREAELKRLLYVATTRARDRLVLVAGGRKEGRSDWIEALGAWGYAVTGAFPSDPSFRDGSVLHRLEPEPKLPELDRGSDASDPSLVAAARRFVAASRKAADSRRGAFHSPSSDSEGRALRDSDGDLAVAPRPAGAGDRSVAIAAGTAVHLLLTLWDRKDATWLVDAAEKAARVAAAGARVDPAPVLARVREVLDGARRAKRLIALAKERAIAREVPLLYLDANGKRWEGTIDCICGTASAPEIIDYKTSASGTADDLARRHAEQLGTYAAAVQRAMGLPAPPAASVTPVH